MEKFPITAAGYARLEAEMKQRKAVDRPAIINAEYSPYYFLRLMCSARI